MRISDWSSDVCSSDLVLGMGQVAGDGAGLVVRDVLELVRRGDVAQGPDVVGRRASELVDADPAVVVELDPGVLQPETVGFGNSSGRDQEHLALHPGDRKSTRLNSSH